MLTSFEKKTNVQFSLVYCPPQGLIFNINNKKINPIYASCSFSGEVSFISLQILKTNCLISLIPLLSLFLSLKSLLQYQQKIEFKSVFFLVVVSKSFNSFVSLILKFSVFSQSLIRKKTNVSQLVSQLVSLIRNAAYI